MICVWDKSKAIPIKTIFDVHGGIGTAALDISSNSKYIVSLSAGKCYRSK
jgi:hypothetical protein